MKRKKNLKFRYKFLDSEPGHQKRLNDAFDVVFDEVEIDDLESIDKKEYEHPASIK